MQMYYELAEERSNRGLEQDIAIVRVEQLAPFPFDLVARELRRYPNAEVCPRKIPLSLVLRCSSTL